MTDGTTTLAQLRALLAEFVRARDWQPYHDAKNLAMSIAIEAAELMEHFQWLRTDELPAALGNPQRRAAVAEELADVLCYALALANTLDLDVSAAVADKVAKNARKYPVERFRGRYFQPEDPP
jgi:NTP pyrophosphatase (non-canonical NTP hydrolase)